MNCLDNISNVVAEIKAKREVQKREEVESQEALRPFFKAGWQDVGQTARLDLAPDVVVAVSWRAGKLNLSVNPGLSVCPLQTAQEGIDFAKELQKELKTL